MVVAILAQVVCGLHGQLDVEVVWGISVRVFDVYTMSFNRETELPSKNNLLYFRIDLSHKQCE